MTTPPVSAQAGTPRNFEELDFSTEDERWNEYELNDGARVKGRLVLLKVSRDPNNPSNFSFKLSQPMWVVSASETLRGEPTPPQTLTNAKKYPVRVITSNEPWNVYRIIRTGQKLKIKLQIDEVLRFADCFDPDGMPVYEIPHGASVNISQSQPTQGP